MPQLRTLPENATLMDVFRKYPATTVPIIEYHEVVMRGPSPLSLAERELIAAYVSGLNTCGYCHGVHTRVAQEHGLDEGVVAEALRDLAASPVDARMKPLLRYVATVTRSPASLTPADAEAVFAAGWDELALHHAIVVCALFNFMNRLVEGHGIAADPTYFAESARRLHDVGYAGLVPLIQP